MPDALLEILPSLWKGRNVFPLVVSRCVPAPPMVGSAMGKIVGGLFALPHQVCLICHPKTSNGVFLSMSFREASSLSTIRGHGLLCMHS